MAKKKEFEEEQKAAEAENKGKKKVRFGKGKKDKKKKKKDNLAGIERKVELREEKQKTEFYKNQLEDREETQQTTKKNKEVVLKETKNKEAEYSKLLEDRLERKEALEAEIRKFEEDLRVAVDPKSLPNPGSGVLAWPLDDIKVTQYFGNTPFATKNPQVYSGMGHNGVDFRASIGTAIKSAKEGPETTEPSTRVELPK